MKLSDSTPERSVCPICQSLIATGAPYCSTCGTPTEQSTAAELRAILYLLSELKRWRAEGSIDGAQAHALVERYERRLDELRAQLASNVKQAEQTETTREAIAPEAHNVSPQPASTSSRPDQPATQSSIQFPLSQSAHPRTQLSETKKPEVARRPLLETLTEPYTLRLLLYTGAGMFVVGIIIWLRDVLYLKLQEPLVQATLLAAGTLIVLVSGWYTTARTRQRLTGRALTLAGSLLFPVNFWFLVRSGLISSAGRAWVVCALCAILYAATAWLLLERLYVYMASVATFATGWALVYSSSRTAPALYALAQTLTALALLHLSRLFPAPAQQSRPAQDAGAPEAAPLAPARSPFEERFSRALWSGPLAHVALAGATLSALLYMTLRLAGPSPSLYQGAFRLTSHDYDPGVAILLFACLAYAVRFAGQYLYTSLRSSLYTLGLLALLWTEFLIFDGLLLSGQLQLLLLATSVLLLSVAARLVRVDWLRRALYVASTFATVMLTPVALMLLAAQTATLMHGAGFVALALAYAVLSAPILSERGAPTAFAYLSALLASIAFLTALSSASLTNATLLTAICAAWPFALYACARLAAGRRLKEGQLVVPFVRTASAEILLLLVWASVAALILFLYQGWAIAPYSALACALVAVILYGGLRAIRERSAFGSSLASLAAVVLVATSLDALQKGGWWPGGWPIAAGVVCAAFALGQAGEWLLRRCAGVVTDQGGLSLADEGSQRLASSARVVLDVATIACALLWFVILLSSINREGFHAASVLLLALAYWTQRALELRSRWPVHLMNAHAGALLLALLAAFRLEPQWFAIWFVLALAPLCYAAHEVARRRNGLEWLAMPLYRAVLATLALALIASLLQATPHLVAGDDRLFAPASTIASVALVCFALSLLSQERRRVRYFRASLYAAVTAYALFCLRAGFEPLVDVEVYTSPIAVLLLVVAYLAYRREWDEYASDTSLLFWTGSILLCAPLLGRALQFRLLFDVPAPWRDLATLCAALVLIVFGIMGRLRAPVIVGVATLLTELAALTLTSVDWLQVPLKIYLVTVGALLALIGWMFEYRREQLMMIRARFNAQRAAARERFNAWR